MKQKKNGRYLNCYIQSDILDDFEEISQMVGKTKTSLLEEAMDKIVSPYRDPETNRVDIKDGIFTDDNMTTSPCKILYHCERLGQQYTAIYKNGMFLKVLSTKVKEAL